LTETEHARSVHLSHAEFFLELAETASPHLKSSGAPIWLRRLEDEHDNLRAALKWSLENVPEVTARLAAAIRHLWTTHGHLHEGRSWSAQILSRNIDMSDTVRWEILTVYGNLSQFQGDVEKAQMLYEESLAVSTRSGDKIQIAQSLRGLAALAYMKDDFELARNLVERAIELSREANDEFGLAASFARLADVANAQDDFEAARDLSAKALAIYRKLDYKEGISAKLNNLGAALFALGDYGEARKCFDEALSTAVELGEKINTRLIFDGFGALAAERGDFNKAAQLSGVAETLGASIGYAPEPAERRFRDSYLKKLHAAMGADEYNAAYREGLRLSLEEATKLAHDRT
jgi:tetratricopeptide (TPR) repeat protein